MVLLLVLKTCSLLLYAKLALASAKPPCHSDVVFDFEDPNQLDCFNLIPKVPGRVSLSSDHLTVKHLNNSLKWNPPGPSTLQLKHPKFTRIPHRWIKRGGIKVWFYKEAPKENKKMDVEFKQSDNLLGKFQVNLDFQGWRGIWVKFSECKVKGKALSRKSVEIDEVNFVLNDADTIYMDLLGFEESFGKQSRDKVVPPIKGVDLYDASNTWQRTYHWSQQPCPPSPLKIDEKKVKSLEHITARLRNWYCDETKTSSNFINDSLLAKRWKSLMSSVKDAHKKYNNLIFDTDGKVVGPPLFCRDCRYGTKKDKTTKKFGFIFEKILLPLALEYYLRSRPNEIAEAAKKHLKELNSGDKNKEKNAFNAIVGEDKRMKKLLKQYLPKPRPLKQKDVEKAIKTLNLDRLDKIINLLDFAKQQGFADGSGFGSLDHEWNRDGAGFMNTLFLLRDSLSIPSNKTRLLDLIKTAKWYNDFREIYQLPEFELKGTTADRMITLLLYRLIIVLMMPSDNDDEIKAKIRDMEALVRWSNNALAVNEGLGGVIKPDFVGFHHKAFYGSAYVPQALHVAALVHYLLGGTEFALSPSSVENIRRGLETLRIIAVKSSTPNSVNGRFPHYYNKALIKAVLPGYAYISISYPSELPSIVPTKVTVTTVSGPEMFLRLYDDPDVTSYLADGGLKKAKYYLNSLGSLEIMEAVKTAADVQGVSAEPSPQGHWSKNFAALSIHRRKDWAVSAKGFNRFLWDFENSKDENVFGMFSSHGALLVANCEKSLEVHDVANGWDWAKVPGATTIAIGTPDVNELKLTKGRFYNPLPLAGGVTFKGTSNLENGLFAMDFEQPDYHLQDWRDNIKLKFKKSVFFFENLLVCLGSNIWAQDTNGKTVQTTLFQDRLLNGIMPSFIIVDGVKKAHRDKFDALTPASGNSYTTLTDAKGNFYYIPEPSKSILKVHVNDQSSKTDDGDKDTSARYGTAWIDHVKFPSSYEYAVLIPTDGYHKNLADITKDQETSGKEVYKILQRDKVAHIVQFLMSPESWSTRNNPITGYAMFEASKALPPDGPVEAVSGPNSLIMVEKTEDSIFISISSPDLNLPTKSGLRGSDDVGQEELYHVSSAERQIEVTLRKSVQESIVYAQTHGNPNCYKANVWVLPDGKTVRFLNLKNGFSVEVKLMLK